MDTVAITIQRIIDFVRKDFNGDYYIVRFVGLLALIAGLTILIKKFLLKELMGDVSGSECNHSFGDPNKDGLNKDSGELKTVYVEGEDIKTEFYGITPFSVTEHNAEHK